MPGVHRGTPKSPGTAERARRVKSHLMKEEAHPNRNHKSIGYAFATRSLSHIFSLIEFDRQEKEGLSLLFDLRTREPHFLCSRWNETHPFLLYGF